MDNKQLFYSQVHGINLLWTIRASADHITSFTLSEPGRSVAHSSDPLLIEAEKQINAYFAGKLKCFDLPLAPVGTAFQRRVWSLLGTIPYGDTISYGEIARVLGDTGASRAVGLANSKNPIAIIIPCHRVVGANGALTGYAHGVSTKKAILMHEQRYRDIRDGELPFI